MKKTKLGAVAKDSSAAYGDVDVESCPVCFAMVASQDAQKHAAWHEGLGGNAPRAGKQARP